MIKICNQCYYYYEIDGRPICRSPHNKSDVITGKLVDSHCRMERSINGDCGVNAKHFIRCTTRTSKGLFGNLYDENAIRVHEPINEKDLRDDVKYNLIRFCNDHPFGEKDFSILIENIKILLDGNPKKSLEEIKFFGSDGKMIFTQSICDDQLDKCAEWMREHGHDELADQMKKEMRPDGYKNVVEYLKEMNSY